MLGYIYVGNDSVNFARAREMDSADCSALPDERSLVFGNRRRNGLSDELLHRTKLRGADFKAIAASQAYVLINDMDLVLPTDDPLFRAFPEADHAGLAKFRIDIIRDDFAKQSVDLIEGVELAVVFFFLETCRQLFPFHLLDVGDETSRPLRAWLSFPFHRCLHLSPAGPSSSASR